MTRLLLQVIKENINVYTSRIKKGVFYKEGKKI
jgi:hypothetical protein